MLDILQRQPKIKQALKKTKEYDDPYYIVMGVREGISAIDRQIHSLKEAHREDIFKWQYALVDDKLAFISVACTKNTMRSFCDALAAFIEDQGFGTKVALVHHNCLAEPADTLAKVAKCYETLEYPAGIGVSVSLQDFADTQGVWEGIENGAFART